VVPSVGGAWALVGAERPLVGSRALGSVLVLTAKGEEIHMWKWIVTLPGLALAACAPSYTYHPAEHATGTINGRVAAYYQIPPAAPQGDVRLASFGLGAVGPANGSAESAPALHLRMVVSNNGPEPWTVDTREQKLDIEGSGLTAPALSTTREGNAGLSLVTVAPGSKSVIDLFFPLPPNQKSAASIPAFDAIWSVHAGEQDVVERTPFDRLRVEPDYYPGYYGYWEGPYWYDPWYPWGFRGAVIVRGPRWRHRG